MGFWALRLLSLSKREEVCLLIGCDLERPRGESGTHWVSRVLANVFGNC